MNKPIANLPRRYPGLKPFERSQSGVFYGREEDIRRLTNLVLRERLVLLFAKSGIGKTSLLQAGCAPELERQEFAPVFFRADKTDVPILDTIRAVLEKNALVSGHDGTDERPGMHQTLWEQMKRHEFDLNGLPATPVLVFDQFEEVFTLGHSEESRRRFLIELAELANETMPEEIRSNLLSEYQQGKQAATVETMQWWENQPDLRIIISIRSDFLHLLDQISTIIPGILRNRYQLQPLSRDKARVAIMQPACATGAYTSAPFTYSEKALAEMVDFLAGQNVGGRQSKEADDTQQPKQKDEIETVNLQIVCQDVEERIIDYQKPDNFEVEPEFYGNIDGLQASIRNFYINQIRAFPKAYNERIQQKEQYGVPITDLDKSLTANTPEFLMTLAQRLIEENLVTSGNRRNSVVDDTLLDTYAVSSDFLDTLVDKSRLLRKEPRLDDFYYEISHDTLLPAIIESRDDRRQDEDADKEKAELESRLQEEAKRREGMEIELRIARQNRKMARIISVMSLASLLVVVAFGIWGASDYVKSVREELRDTQDNVRKEFFGAAIPAYEKLQANPRRRWVLQRIAGIDVGDALNKAQQLQKRYNVIIDSIIYGDRLFFIQKDYAGALRCYHHAKDTTDAYLELNRQLSTGNSEGNAINWVVDTVHIRQKYTTIGQRIESAQQILITQFDVEQGDFEAFNEAQAWNQAVLSLKKMKKLLPQHPEDVVKLRKELNLNEDPRLYVTREMKRCMDLLRKRGINIGE
jgi:hypothetical protein